MLPFQGKGFLLGLLQTGSMGFRKGFCREPGTRPLLLVRRSMSLMCGDLEHKLPSQLPRLHCIGTIVL